MMNKPGLMLIIALTVLCCTKHTSAKLSEKALSNFKTVFLNRIINDNPDQEAHIKKYLNGIIREGHAGMRLLDKFGIFLSNMEKKSIEISKIRFYRNNDRFSLFFVMKDQKDDQLYTMFLEYVYGRGGKCELEESYFSIVFDERMKEIRNFFETR